MLVSLADAKGLCAAAARWCERGHRAYIQPDGSFETVSDSEPGVRRHITWSIASDSRIVFACDCPGGAYRDHRTEPGRWACYHEWGVAASMAWRRLAVLDGDGCWCATDAAYELVDAKRREREARAERVFARL